MSERPTRTKPPTAKLTDANNAEPLALSSHRESVAAHARARAQAAQSTLSSVDTVNVDPATAPINQPPPSGPEIEPPISNKRPSRATVTDEEDSDTEVLSDTTTNQREKNRSVLSMKLVCFLNLF